MSLHSLERRLVVPGDLESVFDFFSRPENLKLLTPPWIRLTVTWASDEAIRAGTLIQYQMKWLGLAMVWESAISEYRAPESFTDVMLRGPYASWRHVHTFKAVARGVEVGDRVEYSLPWGLLGTVAHTALVRTQMARIFEYRAAQATALLGRA